MDIIYLISVSILVLAGILLAGVGVVSITHILRHPHDLSVQNLEGPVREYLLTEEELQAANPVLQ
ncbi:hypothetical protein J2S36_000704 [Arcanobacterium hippocoleae]|uniref:Uncharacterized protein n=2 Tax=Arcanobacterium hippocoleae TaxID=149017 RepID=A0ABU1T1J1_9ACTO|nr:hypothetical protein [Arcanobacterium hippocoleae]MDR6939161.1 hypothetical protein [Arcanobacterium hippocoleae]